MRAEDVFLRAMALIAFVVIVGTVAFSVGRWRLLATCLAAGYPEIRMTWNFEGFCVKRVDQTDIVISAAEIPR